MDVDNVDINVDINEWYYREKKNVTLVKRDMNIDMDENDNLVINNNHNIWPS